MKELSLKEAWLAVADGAIVVDKHGLKVYTTGNGLTAITSDGLIGGSNTLGEGPWRIHKPEPKSLSFEEAARAIFDKKEVFIEFPDYVLKHALARTAKYQLGKMEWGQILCDLDLAERKGWKITETKPQ